MATLSYESRLSRRFPWKAVRTTLVFTGICITVQIVLPLLVLGYSPLVATSALAIPLFALLFFTFRAAIRGRRELGLAGFRNYGSLLLLIPALLTPPVLIETSLAMPLLARYFLRAKTSAEEQRLSTAFHLALLRLNSNYLENDEYPGDLRILLQTDDTHLKYLFPTASPKDLLNLTFMASEMKPLTEKEEAYIEGLANVEYHPITLAPTDKKEYLILYTKTPIGGYQLLGYSSDRMEQVPPAEASKIIAESKAALTTFPK